MAVSILLQADIDAVVQVLTSDFLTQDHKFLPLNRQWQKSQGACHCGKQRHLGAAYRLLSTWPKGKVMHYGQPPSPLWLRQLRPILRRAG